MTPCATHEGLLLRRIGLCLFEICHFQFVVFEAEPTSVTTASSTDTISHAGIARGVEQAQRGRTE